MELPRSAFFLCHTRAPDRSAAATPPRNWETMRDEVRSDIWALERQDSSRHSLRSQVGSGQTHAKNLIAAAFAPDDGFLAISRALMS